MAAAGIGKGVPPLTGRTGEGVNVDVGTEVGVDVGCGVKVGIGVGVGVGIRVEVGMAVFVGDGFMVGVVGMIAVCFSTNAQPDNNVTPRNRFNIIIARRMVMICSTK
jgi:hypothetical protein